MMKKLLPKLAAFGLLLAIWLPAGATQAQNLQQTCTVNPNSTLCQEHNRTQGGSWVTSLLRNIANLVSIVAGVAGVIMIIIGGFRYVRSTGDPNSTSEAQKTIIYALIGLVVAAIGQAVVAFVINRLPD